MPSATIANHRFGDMAAPDTSCPAASVTHSWCEVQLTIVMAMHTYSLLGIIMCKGKTHYFQAEAVTDAGSAHLECLAPQDD